jgi:hypothetical protein
MNAFAFVVIVMLILIVVVLGFLLNKSMKQLKNYDGEMLVYSTEEGGKLYSLNIDGDPADFVNQKSVSFKIKEVDEIE